MTSTARVDEIDMRDLLPYVYVNFQHSSKDLRGICCGLSRYANYDVHQRVLGRSPLNFADAPKLLRFLFQEASEVNSLLFNSG